MSCCRAVSSHRVASPPTTRTSRRFSGGSFRLGLAVTYSPFLSLTLIALCLLSLLHLSLMSPGTTHYSSSISNFCLFPFGYPAHLAYDSLPLFLSFYCLFSLSLSILAATIAQRHCATWLASSDLLVPCTQPHHPRRTLPARVPSRIKCVRVFGSDFHRNLSQFLQARLCCRFVANCAASRAASGNAPLHTHRLSINENVGSEKTSVLSHLSYSASKLDLRIAKGDRKVASKLLKRLFGRFERYHLGNRHSLLVPDLRFQRPSALFSPHANPSQTPACQQCQASQALLG